MVSELWKTGMAELCAWSCVPKFHMAKSLTVPWLSTLLFIPLQTRIMSLPLSSNVSDKTCLCMCKLYLCVEYRKPFQTLESSDPILHTCSFYISSMKAQSQDLPVAGSVVHQSLKNCSFLLAFWSRVSDTGGWHGLCSIICGYRPVFT